MYARAIEIRKMIGEGFPISVIKCEIAKQFKITERAVQDQYYDILSDIAAVVSEERELLRSKLMVRNEAIYEKAVTRGNYKVALDANLAQAKLGGLFEKEDSKAQQPKVIEVSERPRLKAVGEDEQGE